MSVWAIVAVLRTYANDVDKVVEHFGLARADVEAALAYDAGQSI